MGSAARCPYCWKSWRSKDARIHLRIHVANNECGLVPRNVAVEFAPDDKAGENTELLPTVLATAEAHGWLTCHVYPARGRDGRWLTPTSSPGFPDVWLARRGQLLVFELKARKGRTEDGQAEWIDVLDSVPGVTARFAGPDDWPALQAVLVQPLDPARQP